MTRHSDALRAKQESLFNKAKRKIDEITDDMPLDRVKAIEAEVDELLAEFDRLGDLAKRQERVEAIGETLNAGDPRRPFGRDGAVRGDGHSYAAEPAPEIWRDREGREVRVYRPHERIAEEYDADVTFGGLMRAMVCGPRNEAERRALAEGTDSAGGHTVPTPLAQEFIDLLRANSVVVQSGALTVPMTSETLKIAKLTKDPTFAWRAENAAITDNDVTFGAVTFRALSCVALVKASRELLEDSINVEAALTNAFAEAGALEMDRVALIGNSASSEPTGIINVPGINLVDMGTDGAAFTNWDDWLDAVYELELDNVPRPYASVLHPRTARDLRKLKTGLSGDNTPLVMPEALRDVAMRTTTALPINETQGTATDASSVIVGNFSELMIGMRSELRVEVLRERFSDNFQYGFLAHMRLDVQVRHAESFCRIQGVIPAN